MPAIAQANVGMTWLLDLTIPRYAMSGFHITMCGFLAAAATDARQRAGQRRHDMAARLHYTPICNVGFHIEAGGFQYAAAIDARHRAGQRRHDMAASLREIGNAKDRLGWARGPGRHGGGAVAKCGRPLMSA